MISDWLDSFFESYYRHRPVNATFIGMHDWDGRLPDFSENGSGDALAQMRSLLREFPLGDGRPMSAAERTDVRLAQGFLECQIWEYQSRHFHRGNPSTYTGEAVFAVMGLFLTEFAPLEQRVDAAIERMESVQEFLSEGEKNVREAPTAWTERAIRECRGALAFLTEGIDLLIAERRIAAPRFKRAAERAAAAFWAFKAYLERDLLHHPADHYACGAEALGMYLRCGHFLDDDPLEIVTHAETEMAEASRYLTEHAADFGAASPRQALAMLSTLHSTVDRYYARYHELWETVHRAAVANKLLTWPDFPIRYVPQPDWVRKAAPDLYFLHYRSPAAFDRPPVHNYFVVPIEPSMPASEQAKLLQAVHDGAIKMNHVIHHGGIGHHVQNWHAYRSPSRIGRIAAVDCASRIAMFCGGTMAEGWACYATDLTGEAGMLSPLEHYAERQSRIRMCTRAAADIRLHLGLMTLRQAAEYYERHAGMTPESARAESVKNSMFPGTGVMYLLGCDAIHRLKNEMAALQGARFAPERFHDQFLSYGSIPVRLISDVMKENQRVERHTQIIKNEG